MGEAETSPVQELDAFSALSVTHEAIEPMRLAQIQSAPLVSVLVANHNYGRFLPELVQSMLDETYANWELLICDDGSADESPRILQQLAAEDRRIKPLFKENGGQASAWNLAYHHSQGDIICLLDADDWFRRDKLERVVQAFSAHPNAGLVHHRSQATDVSGSAIYRPQPDKLRHGWLWPMAEKRGGYALLCKTSDLCIRREIAARVFPMPTELRGYGDAYISRVASLLTEVAAIPDTLSYYRIHGRNHSGLGLLDQLHAPSLEKWVESHVIVFQCHERFLKEEYGEHVVSRISLNDLREFWDLLGRLYVLHAKPASGILGFPPQAIARNLQRSRKRLLWHLVFSLPHPLSLWLLRVQVRSFEAVKRYAWNVGPAAARLGGFQSRFGVSDR
jgi:glycosyltransferase involved in cell wall biosynthesis